MVYFLSPASQKKSPGQPVKLLFYLTQTKYYFLCQMLPSPWNNTRLYSSANPLHNVPSSVFWFVNFCFLPFLCRTSIEKWKKNWFCFAHKLIGKKEMSARISKCLCRNLFIGATAQLRAVYKDHKILVTFKRCITLSFKFLDLQHKISIILWLFTYKNIFRLFVDSANKTRLLIC